MHNVHFLVVKADSAASAAESAISRLEYYGNENHWSSIGGVAAEDGTDDIENYQQAAYPLSFLDNTEFVLSSQAYYHKAIEYIKMLATELIEIKGEEESAEYIPELYAYEYDMVGMTDVSGDTSGTRRYVVMIDMHS